MSRNTDIAEAIAKNYGAAWEPGRNRLLKLIADALDEAEARAVEVQRIKTTSKDNLETLRIITTPDRAALVVAIIAIACLATLWVVIFI